MTILNKQRLMFSAGVLRLVGYGLLLIAIINIFWLLIPFRSNNAVGELETIGTIIERVPFILLATVLIFYQKKSDRVNVEILCLKNLSWLSLVMAIFLLLVIPLNINNGLQIYHQQNATINTKLIGQQDYIQKYQALLAAANSDNEVVELLQQQTKQKLEIPALVNTKKLKTDILDNLQQKQDNIASQIKAFKAKNRTLLVKNYVRWNLGALTGSTLFWLIWKSTAWARINFPQD